MSYENIFTSDICRLRNSTTARISSWDTTGSNNDFFWEIRETRDTIIRDYLRLRADPTKQGADFQNIVDILYQFEEYYNNNRFDELKSISKKLVKLQQDLGRS